MGQKITRTAEIVELKGAKTLLMDFTGLGGLEIVEAAKENSLAMVSRISNGQKEWLNLNIFTDCYLDDTALKTISRIGKIMEQFFIAMAAVGMHDIQKTLVDMEAKASKSELPYRFFEDLDEAKEWLASMYSNHVNQNK